MAFETSFTFPVPVTIRASVLALSIFLALCAASRAQTADSGIDPGSLQSLAPQADEVAPGIVRAPSSQRRLGQNAGGPANELNTGDERAADSRPLSDITAVAGVATGSDLYHGNCCGPGDRGAGLPATDGLDEACRRHDACYDDAGISDCACDASLKQEAATLAEDGSLPRTIRTRAASVAKSTAIMRCRRRDG